MKYAFSLTPVFTLFAALLGIYFAREGPYTHISAGVVLAITALGIQQAHQASIREKFVKQILSHLTRSIPASFWWKRKVEEYVRKAARSQNYILYRMYYDCSDFHDPEARSIFLFASETSDKDKVSGMLVLAPEDYAELSLFSGKELEREIRQSLFGHWGNDTLEGDASVIGNRVLHIVASLYALPRIGQGFRLALQYSDGVTPLIVNAGDISMSINSNKLKELLQLSPIVRTFQIAKIMEQLDPEVSKFLSQSG